MVGRKCPFRIGPEGLQLSENPSRIQIRLNRNIEAVPLVRVR